MRLQGWEEGILGRATNSQFFFQEHVRWKKEARPKEALPTAPSRAVSSVTGLGTRVKTQSQPSGNSQLQWVGRGPRPLWALLVISLSGHTHPHISYPFTP